MRPREPVFFVRIFMGATGVTAAATGVLLLGISLWRLRHPAPAPIPLPRLVTVGITVAFLLSGIASGVCWVMASLSPRLWEDR